jgi:hypothetical protein
MGLCRKVQIEDAPADEENAGAEAEIAGFNEFDDVARCHVLLITMTRPTLRPGQGIADASMEFTDVIGVDDDIPGRL